MRYVLALLAITFVFGDNASAVTLTDILLLDGTWKITVDGELLSGDQVRFDRLLFETKRKGVVSSVHLNSPGGLVSEGYAFGREIQDQELTTVVERGAICESACFLIFIAGARKIASVDAKIGVHRATRNDIDSDDDTQDVIDYAYRLGNVTDQRVLSGIARAIGSAPPSGMNILSVRELKDLGVQVMP
jgi:hypothetical protein